MKQKEAKRAALATHPKPEARKAGEGVEIDQKLNKFQNEIKRKDEIIIVKKEETSSKPAEKEKQEMDQKKRPLKLAAGDFFDGPSYVPQEERRGGRGGRGGGRGRGGRGRSDRGGRFNDRSERRPRSHAKSAPVLADEAAFPSL